MDSITQIYKIGLGPSSSHTIGPQRASQAIQQRYNNNHYFIVELYGSLAATGKGHLTDKAITEVLGKNLIEIKWFPDKELPGHPNGMKFIVYDEQRHKVDDLIMYSVGGGEISNDGKPHPGTVYEETCLNQIVEYCEKEGMTLWEYVELKESKELHAHLSKIWHHMQRAVEQGLNSEGTLPGGLGLSRKAWSYYRKAKLSGEYYRKGSFLAAYALAVSEENASGHVVVTAPTCGSSGVLPAVLYYLKELTDISDQSIIRALETAGLIGNLVKRNASISGAEVGCQGEIGTACAMAAAAATQILGGTTAQIEYASEMGLEHHLGLTCDPVDGLVQIPCIERNAFAAKRALDCAEHALFSDGRHRVSFDQVLEVMKQTGHDLPSLYRETSGGGLAKALKKNTGRKNEK